MSGYFILVGLFLFQLQHWAGTLVGGVMFLMALDLKIKDLINSKKIEGEKSNG